MVFPSFSSDSSDGDSSSSSQDEGDSEDDRPQYLGQPGVCKLCRGDRRRNKEGHPEPLVRCAKCQADGWIFLPFVFIFLILFWKKKKEKYNQSLQTLGHLTCWDLDIGMMSQVAGYSWECNGEFEHFLLQLGY